MSVLQADQYPQVDFLILADAAQYVNGKLYILGGGWTKTTSKMYPTQINCGIAISLIILTSESMQQYDVNILILNEKNEPVVPDLKATITTRRALGGSEVERANFATNMGIPIPQPGTYKIRATCGQSSKEITFSAVIASQ